jgi:hypothetical protein
MKRYWDHAESERAKMTAEQVEKLLAYELMEQGVLGVEPLKIEDEEPVPLPTRRVYLLREGDGNYGTMLDLGFETVEQAEAARDAIRFRREQSGWQGPFFTRPAKTIQVIAEELPTQDAVMAAKTSLDEQTRRASANTAERARFEKESKKVADATSSVWSDWRACRETEARFQKIRDTFAEYLRMTDGNAALARGFLAKAFPADEIEAALPPAPPEPIKVEG